MLFQTPEFFFLLIITLGAFYFLPKQTRLGTLFIASVIFYAYSGIFNLVLFLFVLGIIYLLSKFIQPQGDKHILVLCLIILFGNLISFKYSGFIYDNLRGFAQIFNISLPGYNFNLLLPIGISFYTFELASYCLDIYSGKIKPHNNFWEFAVFIMFFGHMIAGPIMRAGDFIPQIQKLKKVNYAAFGAGTVLILIGLFKKVVVADKLALIVDQGFLHWDTLNQPQAWILAYLFAFQIYYDFSGYSDIAVGLGKVFGLKLNRNFNSPYISANPSEFWRRWHITLSEWLRDYIYIPLGGNRKGKIRQYSNFIITMVLGGVWHGAAWTFVLWGLFHGLIQVVYKLMGKVNKLLPSYVWLRIVAIFITFNLICIGWVFFRSPRIDIALYFISTMFARPQAGYWLKELTSSGFVFALLFYVLHWIEYGFYQNLNWCISKWNTLWSPVRGLIYATIVLWIILSVPIQQKATFIYFQF